MGISGAAWATIIAQLVTAIMVIWHFLSEKSPIIYTALYVILFNLNNHTTDFLLCTYKVCFFVIVFLIILLLLLDILLLLRLVYNCYIYASNKKNRPHYLYPLSVAGIAIFNICFQFFINFHFILFCLHLKFYWSFAVKSKAELITTATEPAL